MKNGKSLELWSVRAKELGFDTAAPLDIATLQVRQDIRDMCAADKCRAYGKNWTCPPECGTLEECAEQMKRYTYGILLQTVGTMQKTIDTKAIYETEKKHIKNFYRFAEMIKEAYPDALCLGAGGCRICGTCAYPEPCRFPEKACSSMEGYGLFVTQVCRDNQVKYYYGSKTVTYTACVLWN